MKDVDDIALCLAMWSTFKVLGIERVETKEVMMFYGQLLIVAPKVEKAKVLDLVSYSEGRDGGDCKGCCVCIRQHHAEILLQLTCLMNLMRFECIKLQKPTKLLKCTTKSMLHEMQLLQLEDGSMAQYGCYT